MLKDIQVLDNVWEVLGNKNIILYGASGAGERMLETLHDVGFDAVAYCDSDDSKAGTMFCNRPVLSRKELSQYKDNYDYFVIISSCYTMEIQKELEDTVEWTSDYATMFAVRWGFWFSMQEENEVPDRAKVYWEKKKKYLLVEKVCHNTIGSTVSGLSSWQLKSLLFEKDPYVAFQPAKVGSSSICIELAKYGKNVIHLHDIRGFFSEHPASEEEKKFILDSIRNVKNLKIITGVRDPIAKDISLVFSAFGDGAQFTYKWNMKDGFLGGLHERIIGNTALFNFPLPKSYDWNVYIKHNSVYGAVFDWFDLEIKEYFGIDVFEEDFDKEKGYSVIKKDNIEIFLYKMEKLNDLEKELQEFLGIKDFKIQHENNSENKNYLLTYKQVVKQIELQQEYIDFYYKDNPRMQHFYTEEEIAAFRKKWERN